DRPRGLAGPRAAGGRAGRALSAGTTGRTTSGPLGAGAAARRRPGRHATPLAGSRFMTDDLSPGPLGREAPPPPAADRQARDNQTLGSSTIYRLCEEVISLRERNNRQHTEFERRLNAVRDDLKTSFNSFAADTQRAYQQLRQETVGEKKVSLALLNELLEVGQDLEHIVAARPPLDDVEALRRWAESM